MRPGHWPVGWGHGGVGGIPDDCGLHDDGADGDHNVGVYAGEDDDVRGRSSKYKTSQEKKRERGRCLKDQSLMMAHSNLVLFLATIIFEKEDVSNPRAFQHGGEGDVPKYHTRCRVPYRSGSCNQLASRSRA
jgi:hypothetical protein